MIKKTGYVVLSIISYGILESILIGYEYYIVLTILLFFVISTDIIVFNYSGSLLVGNLRVDRETDTKTFRKNEPFQIKLIFTNKNKYSISVFFFDEALDILDISKEHSGTISIPANGQKEINYMVTPKYIGKYSLGDVKVNLYDLFKLAYLEKKFKTAMDIKIAPSHNDIKTNRTEMLSNFLYTYGVHHSKKVGQGYNLYGIRPYNEEDDPRYIVWNRYNEENNNIMIKEMEEEKEITMVFLIDYSVSMNNGSKDRIYDKTITEVINSSYYILKNRDNVGFFLFSSEINYFIKPDKNGNSIKKLEQVIANILPAGTFDIKQAISELNKKIRKKYIIFIITADDLEVKEPLKTYNTTVFLINKETFYEYNPDNAFDSLLFKSFKLNELRRIENQIKFLRSYGLKCKYINKDEMARKIIIEYNYDRSINMGA